MDTLNKSYSTLLRVKDSFHNVVAILPRHNHQNHIIMIITDYKHFLTKVAKYHISNALKKVNYLCGLSLREFDLINIEVREIDYTIYATLILDYTKLFELVDYINHFDTGAIVSIDDNMLYRHIIDNLQKNIAKDIVTTLGYIDTVVDRVGDNINIYRTRPKKDNSGYYQTNNHFVITSDTDNSFYLQIVDTEE